MCIRYCVKAAHVLGVALPAGWVHMVFSCLGVDRTMIRSVVIGQIGTGGCAVIGVLLIPIVPGAPITAQPPVPI